MNKWLLILLLAISITTLTQAADPVYFADPNLKTAVEDELGITDPNTTDMLGLLSLDADSRAITDLTGLEYAINLGWLSLWDNQITDFNSISNLTNLIELDLSSNLISDINDISNLTSLAFLYLGSNQISDISPLANLTNLIYLYIPNNQITDITILSGLTNLVYLYISNNQISEIKSLANLTGLTYLSLHANPLNQAAYCVYLPLIEDNMPEIHNLTYDPDPTPLAGDCDGDCRVDFFDFALLANNWNLTNCGQCNDVDLNNDNNVDPNDLKFIADNWLGQTDILLYELTLDNDPNWITQGQWEYGHPTGDGGIGFGNPDPNNGYTDANVYGVNLNGDYSTAAGGPYYLTAGPFDCSYFHNTKLKFARWLNTDDPNHVASSIEVSSDGVFWQPVWQHTELLPITDSDWQLIEYDISGIADGQPTVYIRWSYQILINANPYSGWNIDDIRILATPYP